MSSAFAVAVLTNMRLTNRLSKWLSRRESHAVATIRWQQTPTPCALIRGTPSAMRMGSANHWVTMDGNMQREVRSTDRQKPVRRQADGASLEEGKAPLASSMAPGTTVWTIEKNSCETKYREFVADGVWWFSCNIVGARAGVRWSPSSLRTTRCHFGAYALPKSPLPDAHKVHNRLSRGLAPFLRRPRGSSRSAASRPLTLSRSSCRPATGSCRGRGWCGHLGDLDH